jgi:NTE family protein
LYDNSPLRATIERLVDFHRLNKGGVRVSVNCVDIATGEEVVFDSEKVEITADHILASTSITPGFSPVEIDGRMYCDPGYVNNTPIDIAFETPTHEDMLVIALELFCLRSPRPKSLDAVLERTQDIMFASTTARTIRALRKEFSLRAQLDEGLPSITLLHSVYQTLAHEISLKTLDFSRGSVADRWAAGFADMAAGLTKVECTVPASGLTYLPVHDVVGIKKGTLQSVGPSIRD